MSHLIEMKGVSKFYSDHDTVSTGFSKIDLNLDLGEFVVVTGESGGGKSTLLNVISGLDTYEEGEMSVAGQDTSNFDTEDYENYRKTYIGNIFQDYNLINSYTVYQNVELVMMLNGDKRKDRKTTIMAILRWLGLRQYARTRVSHLSGGQKQRVAIARAFAKDAPIIVADEPTGNLDSESAALVMETLYKVSKEKLVVLVTHNYDQAEPYATRRISMRDGRIIEDQQLKETVRESEEQEAAVLETASKHSKRKLSAPAQLRLGVRNIFNLPAKLLLLLFIYLFVSAAVLGGYSSLMSQEHENSILGSSMYFSDTSPERIILKKQDGKAFTTADYKAIKAMDNIDHIVKNDLALDQSVSLESDDMDASGPAYSASTIKNKKLTYGRLPEKINEVVLEVNDMSYAYYEVTDMGEKLVGKTYYMDTYTMDYGSGGRILDQKMKVVGVVISKDSDASNDNDYSYGNSTFYVTDKLANKILVAFVANSSDVTMTFNGTRTSRGEYEQAIYPTDKVSKGNVWISQDDADSYYDEGNANGKTVNLKVTNHYFTSNRSLTVTQVFKDTNIKDLLGYSKDDYDTYSQCVFVSNEDFNKLYDKGNYQISAYMSNENHSDTTLAALQKAGYETLSMKELMDDSTNAFSLIGKIFRRVLLGALFVAMFFIAYGVIRLVMRSRNTYYSTLRILGATRGNTANLLRIELVGVMFLAVGILLTFVTLVNNGTIPLEAVKENVAYMRPRYYGALVIIMFIMSLLISGRYSRKIFKKSAMTAYRGEA